ncbi:MAG: hypothetical protein AAF467_12845 [Actinomycetota bacterium]
MTATASRRVLAAGRLIAFVLVTAAIVAVSSERMFWYWSTSLSDHLIVTLAYSPAIAGVLWAISRHHLAGVTGLVLAAPLMGYYVEGVFTPIVYTGGPTPLFPLWFAAWHGVLSVGLLLCAIRWCLVTGRASSLAALSAGLGVFWGLWSITLTLPENVNDPELIADHGGALTVLDPLAFTGYAVLFTLVVMAGHALLGLGLWPARFDPPRWARWLWMLYTAVMVIAWTFVVPWAAPMFVVLMAAQFWVLRRSERPGAHRSILVDLDRPIRWPLLAALTPMAALAAATYALLWWVDLSNDVLRVIFYGVIAVQTLAMAAALAWAVRRALRAPQPPVAPPVRPTGGSIGSTG